MTGDCLTFAPAAGPEIQLINRAYRAWGYAAKAGRADRVWAARDAQGWVGALRLLPVASGGWLLRSLCVAPARRGQGIGANLLRAALAAQGPVPVYCYPFAERTAFYRRQGFVEVGIEAVPPAVAGPWQRHRQRGRDLALMRRG